MVVGEIRKARILVSSLSHRDVQRVLDRIEILILAQVHGVPDVSINSK